MKPTLFCLLFFILSGFENYQKQNLYSNSSEIKQIEIRYVDFDIETPIRIDCQIFNYFGKDIKLKKIEDSKTISKILNFLENANENETKVGIDVRFKMKIKYNSGKTEEICGNEAFIGMKNKQYLMDKSFLDCLLKLLK